MTPHRKKCPHVVHFIVLRDWFEINSRYQKRHSEDGKKFRGCRGLLGRVISSQLGASHTRSHNLIRGPFLESSRNFSGPQSHFQSICFSNQGGVYALNYLNEQSLCS